MKRMFDKEEIVEIAKEEGGSITVDSELSPTSENPVQNKVIYEALEDAGSKLYAHYLSGQVSISTATVYIKAILITNKPDAYTKQTLAQLLYNSASNFGSLPVYVQINSGTLSYIITDFRLTPVFSGADVYLGWNEIAYANDTFTHAQKTAIINNFMDSVVEL